MTTRARVAAALLVLCLVIGAALVVHTQWRIAAPLPVRDTEAQRDTGSVRKPAVDEGGGAASGPHAMHGRAGVTAPREADPGQRPGTRSQLTDETKGAPAVGAEMAEIGQAGAARTRDASVRNLPKLENQKSGLKGGTDERGNGFTDEMAQQAGLPPGTRFAAPFSSATASLDGTAPLVEKNTDHEVDDGIYFPPDAELAYPDRSGVQGDAGTLALWVEPVDWTGSDASVHSLFRINDPQERGYRFHLLKDASNLRFQFITEHGESNLMVPIDWWPRGEGHHVAATWGDTTLRLYVDGVALNEQSYEGTLNVTPAAPGWWGSTNEGGSPGAGAILKNTLVADRPFNEAEIQSLWEGH